MSRLIFMLEEKSMKVFLENFLPRSFPELDFLCIAHEGKKDLRKSIPRKLRSWAQPDVRFMILIDNDGGDCQVLKQELTQLCREGGRRDTFVRIVCQELESWYLGDLDAVAKAFSKDRIRAMRSNARFRNPDSIPSPSRVLKDLVPEFQKVLAARKIALELDVDRNSSRSFQVFREAVSRC